MVRNSGRFSAPGIRRTIPLHWCAISVDRLCETAYPLMLHIAIKDLHRSSYVKGLLAISAARAIPWVFFSMDVNI